MNAKRGSVYVITGNDLIKIGKSSDPEQRLKMLQLAAPVSLELVFQTEILDFASQVEAEAHRALADKRVDDTEWFRVSVEEGVNAIQEALEFGANKGEMIHFRLSAKLLNEIEEFAIEEERTVSNAIRRLLVVALDERRKGTAKAA